MAGDMSHYYTPRGKLVSPNTPGALPSVTTILDVRNKPELNAWRMRVGGKAATKRQEDSAARGTAVHLLVSNWINGLPVEAEHPEHEERLHGFINWQEKRKPTGLESEIFLRSKNYGYAGSADLICRLDGELWLIDVKTSRNLDPSFGLQVRAYEQALFELRGEHARTGVLQLTGDTKCGYRFREYNEPLEVFLACKTVFEWEQKYKKKEFDGRYILVP